MFAFAGLHPLAGIWPLAGSDGTPAAAFVVYIDPRQAVLISGPAEDPFAVDPFQAVLIASSPDDSFAVDPHEAVLIQ